MFVNLKNRPDATLHLGMPYYKVGGFHSKTKNQKPTIKGGI